MAIISRIKLCIQISRLPTTHHHKKLAHFYYLQIWILKSLIIRWYWKAKKLSVFKTILNIPNGTSKISMTALRKLIMNTIARIKANLYMKRWKRTNTMKTMVLKRFRKSILIYWVNCSYQSIRISNFLFHLHDQVNYNKWKSNHDWLIIIN